MHLLLSSDVSILLYCDARAGSWDILYEFLYNYSVYYVTLIVFQQKRDVDPMLIYCSLNQHWIARYVCWYAVMLSYCYVVIRAGL